MSTLPAAVSRRAFLQHAGSGLGAIALASLLHDEGLAATGADTQPALPQPHFKPRVKRVIHLFMHGGPSHIDLYDPKPDLLKYAGQPLPESFGMVMTRRNVAANPLLAPLKPFRPRGESGLQISDFLPELARCADDLCVIRSCHGDSVNHPQSVYQMNCGSILMGKPSMGAWVSYGLGSENQDMPAYIVMPDPSGGSKGGAPAWGNGFLPASHQGTLLRPGKSPILHLAPPPQISSARQRAILDFVAERDAEHLAQRDNDDTLQARIKAYELAYRMQTAAPDLVNLAHETEETLKLYGIGEKETDEFGTRCLLARRLVEQGVRFVQLYSGGTGGWDAHEDVLDNHTKMCGHTDKPIAALLQDLKRRGLWEDTLVIGGGEFGRMPMSEQGKGRDHNPWGYTVWLAGGGVQGGIAYGATDAIGLRAVENKVHVHDLHATILHLLGIDHERLTFLNNGREERLTDVAGRVVTDILS